MVVEEADQAESRKDFVQKLSIALKEAVEMKNWLRLLRDSETLATKISDSLLHDRVQIQKILTASTKTTKSEKL